MVVVGVERSEAGVRGGLLEGEVWVRFVEGSG